MSSKIDQLVKRIEMLETAVFGVPQEKGTSSKYNNKKKAKAAKPKSITIPQDIENLPHSEVVELAKHVFAKHYTPEDLAKISLQIQKEDLISAIKGESMLGVVVDPIGEVRAEIFDYINNNAILKSTLDCSMYCPTCPYSKVVNCYSINQRRIKHDNAAKY